MNAINLNTTVLEVEQTPESTHYYKLSYNLKGIKKRCRKSELHFFHLGRVDLNYDHNQIIETVRASIDTNIKEVYSMVNIHLDFITSTAEGFEQWMPFSDKNIKINYQYTKSQTI